MQVLRAGNDGPLCFSDVIAERRVDVLQRSQDQLVFSGMIQALFRASRPEDFERGCQDQPEFWKNASERLREVPQAFSRERPSIEWGTEIPIELKTVGATSTMFGRTVTRNSAGRLM